MTGRDPGTAEGQLGVQLAIPLRASGRSRRRGSAIAALRWAPFVVPAVALTALFVLYPSLDAIRLSFHDWAGYGPLTSVGFDNYSRLLQDELFRQALLRSAIIAGIVTVATVGIGTAMAVLFDRGLPMRGALQFLIFLPVVLPTTFIAVAWAVGLDPYLGWFTTIVHTFSEDAQVNLLSTGSGIYIVAAVAVLQTVGLPMIVILGALSKVSPEIHEAATLEGVNGFQRAWRISVPLVRDVIAAMAMLQFVWHFAAFEYIFIMTNGGPGTATEVSSTFMFHQAFVSREFGYASASAVVTSLVVATIVMIYFTLLRPRAIERAG
jgi:raffinose/stachyose/melibiose transport system permease protein